MRFLMLLTLNMAWIATNSLLAEAVPPGLQKGVSTSRPPDVPAGRSDKSSGARDVLLAQQDAPKPPGASVEKTAGAKPDNGKPGQGQAQDVTKQQPPTLHILAIGISKYLNSDFDLKYADRDATEFAAALAKSAKGLFAETKTKLLLNSEATRAKVEAALDALDNASQAGDVVVVFVSANGLSKGKQFYLGTHDVDPKSLISTSVSNSFVASAIRVLTDKRCKVVVITDTLNLAAPQADRIFDPADSGCIMVAPSIGGVSRIEKDEWKHGAFTKGLLDTLADPKVYSGKDGQLFVGDFVFATRRRLRELAGSKYRMPVTWPSAVNDFPIAKAAK